MMTSSKTVVAALFAAMAALVPAIHTIAAQSAPAQAAPAQAQSARPTEPSQARQGARPVVTVGSQGYVPKHAPFTAAQIDNGGGLFLQNCAFCHGKDAGGGESGPDLTRSKLVEGDKNGEAIGAVVHNGRVERACPASA